MKTYFKNLVLAALPIFIVLQIFAQSKQQFALLGDFRLENGQTIRDCKVGYRTYGKLNKDASNAILVPTWFSGNTKEWVEFVGPGKLIDSTNFFVILVDAFGNGVSSSPSNSASQPGVVFPNFSIRDMVKSQYLLVTEKLHLKHLYAVAGISMGGMQTFQWLVSYPDFMDKAVPVIGTTGQTSYDLLLWNSELRVIENYRKNGISDSVAMAMVNMIHELALYTPAYHVSNTSPDKFPEWLGKKDKTHAHFPPLDWASQLRAMIGHDVTKSFGQSEEKTAAAIKAKVLMVLAQQDHMVNPSPALRLAALLKAETLILTGDCGHIAFKCEMDKVVPVIEKFLAK